VPTRKTEKLIEIHEFYVVRSASGSLLSLCPECPGGDAVMVKPEQAAVAARVPVRMIYRWVETGRVHFRDQPNGSIVVCVKSLPAASSQTEGGS